MIDLRNQGDRAERELWPVMQRHFPLYEEFWRLHVATLRGRDGQIRSDIDARLERMAQENYKCFISSATAQKLLTDDSHPENTFSSLQNAANSAQHVIQYFDSVRADCLKVSERIDCGALREYAASIALYRNYVHEGVTPRLQRNGRGMMPTSDQLKSGNYKRWSQLRSAPETDLVSILDAMRSSFNELMMLFDTSWRQMIVISPTVLKFGPLCRAAAARKKR